MIENYNQPKVDENRLIDVTCQDCRSYHSIPNDKGLTDYCLFKGRFIKQNDLEKACGVFQPK